ncbi:MAG: TadE/TadG family type IV pilus assembly protein [Alphaproteobacteria bacterium]|nr:TadE/TadG family type IV pilus assembly protein [Alphaproteobacteria bacterium]
MMARIRSTIAKLGDAQGNALIEFAFVVMVLGVLGVGMFDFGRYGMLYTRAHNAARAGVQYGTLSDDTAVDVAGMTNAARFDAQVEDDEEDFVVQARRFCMCPADDDETNCANNCDDGAYAPVFVEVTVTDSLDLFFDYPGIDASLPIVTRAQMRAR